MIDGKSFSVIITTYRRYDTLGQVIQGWLDNNPDQLWVVDNNGKYKLEQRHQGRVVLFSMPVDFHTRSDYALAPLTDGDLVIFADDDAVPKLGLLEDLYKGWKTVGGIVGVMGRVFTSDIYTKCPKVRCESISEPTRTGSIGIIYMTPRDFICFDTKGMHRIDDDMWWLMKNFPRVPKHVVPTNKYSNLPTANDQDCMWHADSAERGIRQNCYKQYYDSFYKSLGLVW